MFWWGLIIGMIIGACIGYFIAAMIFSGSLSDRQRHTALITGNNIPDAFGKSPIDVVFMDIYYLELISRAFGIPPEILFHEIKEQKNDHRAL